MIQDSEVETVELKIKNLNLLREGIEEGINKYS